MTSRPYAATSTLFATQVRQKAMGLRMVIGKSHLSAAGSDTVSILIVALRKSLGRRSVLEVRSIVSDDCHIVPHVVISVMVARGRYFVYLRRYCQGT